MVANGGEPNTGGRSDRVGRPLEDDEFNGLEPPT